MRYLDIFQEVYNQGVISTRLTPLLQKKCNWEEDDSLAIIEIIINNIYQNISETLQEKEYNQIVHSIFDALTNIKKNEQYAYILEKIEYLRFVNSVHSTYQYNRRGQFHYCYDCFIRSLFDEKIENGEQYEINTDLIWSLLYSKSVFIKNNYETIITDWLNELYYYSRSFSGLKDWGELFIASVIEFILSRNETNTNLLNMASNVYAWGDLYDHKNEILLLEQYLKLIYNSTSWYDESREFKKLSALQLILIKKTNKNEKENYYNELITNEKLVPQEILQCVAQIVDDIDEFKNKFDIIINTIIKINQLDTKTQLTPLSFRSYKVRTFKILLNLVDIACTNGSNNLSQSIITTYFNKPQLEDNSILFIIPNHILGIVYCANNQSIIVKQNTPSIMENLINVSNQALNQINLVRGIQNQQIYLPTRDMGMPNAALAEPYLDSLNSLYDFRVIDTEFPYNSEGICQIDYNWLPIQALMMKQIGKTLPIFSSLESKTPFSETKKILFWKGSSFTSEIEAIAVENICKHANIHIDTVEVENASVENFLSIYSSSEYDIIWISSHGEHMHYEPSYSVINLSEKNSIDLFSLCQVPIPTEKRRLLFLNLCEGGANTQTGEFGSIGFGNVLTNSKQDILSHLWMIHPKVGMVYGVLFIIGIADKKFNFFDAFTWSLKIIIDGKESIITELNNSTAPQDSIIDRILNDDSIDWSSIFSWGSPIYYS